MTTLSLKNRPTRSIVTVPLEDWYEELADDSLNPESQLLRDEESDDEDNYQPSPFSEYTQFLFSKDNEIYIPTHNQPLEIPMSTNTIAKEKTFDVKQWLKTAAILTEVEPPKSEKVYTCPEWLTLKSGTICEANAFTVTAGVIKATRQVMDAINYTRRQHEAAVENLIVQELRATRVTAEKYNFGPDITKLGKQLSNKGGALDAPGFNPDGVEFNEALVEAQHEVEKLEIVLENGERIINDIVEWVMENAEDLNLKVETGVTTKIGIIGNEIRTAKYDLLTPDTLLLGVAAQRAFIRSNR